MTPTTIEHLRDLQLTNADADTLADLVAMKARLDRADPVLHAALKRAVVEIAFLVETRTIEVARRIGLDATMQIADEQHKEQSADAREELIEALAAREHANT